MKNFFKKLTGQFTESPKERQEEPQKAQKEAASREPAVNAAPQSPHVSASPQKSPSNTGTSKPSVNHVNKPRNVQTGRSPIYGTGYSNLADLAYKKIEVMMNLEGYAKDAGLFQLLDGWGPEYAVKSYKGAPQNYQAIIDAIYEYHRHYPDQEIEKELDEAIREYMLKMKSTLLRDVDTTYNILEYIYNQQVKHAATFELNLKEYLSIFKENVLISANERPEKFSNVNIHDYIEKREQYFM
jgi:hypothetical protein